MSRVVVTNYVTLDGVMQGPGHPEEDRRDGFDHGGWHPPYADAVMGEVMAEGIAKGGSMLFGRLTYEKMASYWPFQPDDDPYAAVLNKRPKHVASATLEEPLAWENTTLLKGDAGDAVSELKAQPGGDIVVLGSGDLTRSLMRRNLVDEYVLSIHPLVLGAGRRLFTGETPWTAFELVSSTATTTGVIIATYRPVGPGAAVAD